MNFGAGIPIGRLFGIPVLLHWTWFIALALFTVSIGTEIGTPRGFTQFGAYTIGFLTALVAFASLLAHEFGHALAARRYGIRTERIALFMLGGVAQIQDEPRSPRQELVIAVAGPLVSLGCMVLFGAIYMGAYFLLNAEAGTSLGLLPRVISDMAGFLALINFVFAAFNMIPGFPMDGGRVLRAIVWGAKGDYLFATRVAVAVGRGVAALMVGLGAVAILTGTGGFVLVLLGIFLWWLASMSLRQAEMKSAFDSVFVRDLMRPVQVVVPAEMSIDQVTRDFFSRLNDDRFPVVRGSLLLGYISADDIAAVDRTRWPGTTAERLARPYRQNDVLEPNQDAYAAMQRVARSGRLNMPVFHNRQLVGFLFVQDVMHYVGRIAGRMT